MDGAEFLARSLELQPEASRIVLTGYSEAEAASRAVNEGRVSRFLFKPCIPQKLLEAVRVGVSEWAVRRAERLVFEGTLVGAVSALTEALALAQPKIFGRMRKVAEHVDRLAVVDGQESWEVSSAARLFNIGVVALPAESAERYFDGEVLRDSEREMVERIPASGEQILRRIPRLEKVREIIQQVYRQRPAEWGAKAIRIAWEFELLDRRLGRQRALEELPRQVGELDPRLVQLFLRTLVHKGESTEDSQTRACTIGQIEVGMMLAEDVLAADGQFLVARGQIVTETLLERLVNVNRTRGVRQPILVEPPKAANSSPANPGAVNPQGATAGRQSRDGLPSAGRRGTR